MIAGTQKNRIQRRTIIQPTGTEAKSSCRKNRLLPKGGGNILILGGTDESKRSAFTVPNILQASGSYVITDHSGYLYRTYGPFLRSRRYNVRCLDLRNPWKSRSYNPLYYMETNEDAEELAEILVRNTYPDIINEEEEKSEIAFLTRNTRIPPPLQAVG